MRTRTIFIIGASLAAAAAAVPASAGTPARPGGWTRPPMQGGGHWNRPHGVRPMPGGGWNKPRPGGVHWNKPRPGNHWNGNGHRWGHRQSGRWYAGWSAPGGWGGYQRPVYGYVLPSYWTNPTYYIGNYGTYGLPAPAYGYGWSRYYDDAVMTDGYGRVYDYRSDIDWGRYDGGYDDDGRYDDGDRGVSYDRRDTGLGGAAIGAVAGGIAGNVIAGRGNRTAGTLIGAGVGAVAGYAIDKAEDGRRAPPPPRGGPAPAPDYGAPYADDGVTYGGDYDGRWEGTWYGRDGTTYSGAYEGSYQGTARGSYGTDYDAPPMAPAPAYRPGPAPVPGYGGGYVAGGYFYPAPTTTTVIVNPASTTTTTTTTYVTEQVRSGPAVRRRVTKSCHCK